MERGPSQVGAGRGVLERGRVEQDRGVVLGGGRLGVVHHQPVVEGALQLHGLVAQGDVADVGVVVLHAQAAVRGLHGSDLTHALVAVPARQAAT